MKLYSEHKLRFISTLFLFIFIIAPAFAQSSLDASSSIFPKVLIPPKIECVLTTKIDSFFFRNNIYVPTNFDVYVCVTNRDTLDATNVRASLVSNTRFIILPPSTKLLIDILKPGETICDSFRCVMTTRFPDDGTDTIRAVVTTENGGSAVCEKSHWVEHEHRPLFKTNCTTADSNIVWDDLTNDYIPNPFVVNFEVTNWGDNNSDSTQILLILPNGLSPDPSNSPIKSIGTLDSNGSVKVSFNVRALKTYVDSKLRILIQVQGKGGLGNRIIIDSCERWINVQAARQAEYNIKCDYLPDSVIFKDHRYQPSPFYYRFDVTNIGTGDGQKVKAQLLLPPSIQLDPPPPPNPGPIIDLGTLLKGATKSNVWRLLPKPRTTIDTVVICMIVYDEFQNQDTCCDVIIIDSMRCGRFGVTLICPDSIKVDTINGIYLNNPFNIQFIVQNIGSDPIDSVRATLTIEDPDVIALTPKEIRIDTMAVGQINTLTWTCNANPRGIAGKVRFRLKVETTLPGSCTDPATAECIVYIPPLKAPNLILDCATVPPDTVRYDIGLGAYSPDTVLYKAIIGNNGGAPAQNVCATLLIAPGFYSLDSATQCLPRPVTLTIRDTITWRLIPLQRQYGASISLCAKVTSTNATEDTVCCPVYVVAKPWTSAIAITQDNVGYYTQEIKVPMTIDNCDNKDIKEMDIELQYKPTVVSFKSLDLKGTLMSNWTATATATPPGYLHIQASNQNQPLTGAGVLLYMWYRAEFGAPPDQLKVDISGLDFITTPWPNPKPIFNKGTILVRTTDGKVTVSGDCIRPMDASDRYIISQSRPNPFNPSTVIDYAVPEECHVRILVNDALGRPVQTLVNEVKQKGSYQVVFDGSNFPSGIYFYKMETVKYSKVMKMVLAR